MRLISDTHTVVTGKPGNFIEVPPGEPFDGEASLVERGIARPDDGAGEPEPVTADDDTGAGTAGPGDTGGDDAGAQESASTSDNDTGGNDAGGDTGEVAAGGDATGEATPDVINVNTATAEQLAEVIPRVGKQTAADIVARREARPFESLEDLAKVGGVGRASVAKVRDRLTV
jgi:competence protein ComEA